MKAGVGLLVALVIIQAVDAQEGASWKQITVGGYDVSHRYGSAGVYCGGLDVMVLFGGTTLGPTLEKDLLVLDFQSKIWHNTAQSGDIPDGRSYHGMDVFEDDLSTCRLVLYGGKLSQESYDKEKESLVEYHARESLYFGELKRGEGGQGFTIFWTRLKIDGASPKARKEFVMAKHQNDFYVFGGAEALATAVLFNDFWKLELNATNATARWTNLNPTVARGETMDGLRGASCVVLYNTGLNQYDLAVVGGLVLDPSRPSNIRATKSVWLYSFANNQWRRVPGPTEGISFTRAYHTVVEYQGSVVSYGGFSRTLSSDVRIREIDNIYGTVLVSDVTRTNPAWQCNGAPADFSVNSDDDIWCTPMLMPTDPQPARRMSHVMVKRGSSFIIFGGFSDDQGYLSDVWEFDLSQGTANMVQAKETIPASFSAVISSLYFVMGMFLVVVVVFFVHAYRNRDLFGDYDFTNEENQYGEPQKDRGARKSFIATLPLMKYNPQEQGNIGYASSNETCAICLSNFDLDESIRKLPCNHFFHVECVDSWLVINKTCPLCKQDVQGDKAESDDVV